MDFKERLKQEYLELKDKHDKLVEFLYNGGKSTEVKTKIGAAQTYLLGKQETAMREYLYILKVRLEDLKIEVE